MATAQRPLSPEAVQEANERLWAANPELARRQLTMGPDDYEYRREWMRYYNEALERGGGPPGGGGNVDDPSQPCPGTTTADLSVTVTRTNDGQPVEGADVRITGPESRNGTTDASGNVLFRCVALGAYDVAAIKIAHSTAETAAVVSAGMTNFASLELTADAVLTVTVIDANTRNPIDGATVRISGPELREATTNAAGEAVFAGVMLEAYDVAATADNYRVGNGTVTIAAGQNRTTVAIVPQRRYTLDRVQWRTATAYCGDNAALEAIVVGYPGSEPATVEVLHPTTGNPMATLNATVTGGRIDATWVAKAATANWRTDRIRFRVNVPSLGLSGTSANEFTFRQRPTTAYELKNVAHASGNGYGPSHEKHDARLEANRVHYSLKLKLTGDPFSAAKQTAAKNLIQNVWNNGFSGKSFHRTGCGRGRACDCTFDCCKAGFRLDVDYVNSGEHLEVEVHATAPGAPTHRSSMNGDGGEWGDPAKSPTTTYPHETGHVLGQADEYPTGAIDPTGTQPADAAAAGEPNLMSTPGNQTLLNRHYRFVLAFLNSKTSGDTYETIPP